MNTIFVEAQRLFRKHKHGMDVVALELLQRLRDNPALKVEVLVKEDEDHCLEASSSLSVKSLKSLFYPLWEQWLLPGYLRNKKGILHCTGNTAPLFGKMPLLVTIHDLIFLEENYLLKKNGGSMYQRFGNFYRSLVVPVIAKKAKHIITVSEFQRQLIIKKLQVSDQKVSVVYNGADERFFVCAEKEVIAPVLKKYATDFPYIFFLANTEPRKNTEGVIKAFVQFCKQHPGFSQRLVIKGLKREQLDRKIEECHAKEFASRIHLVGYIDYNDLPLIYQGADMLWFPSFSEGFGLPIVEAMAGGTPVITSNVSVVPEIAGEAALYVNPNNYAELVEQSVRLLTDAGLRDRLVLSGKQRASVFTWKSSAVALFKIYNRLLRSLEKQDSHDAKQLVSLAAASLKGHM